MLKVQYAHDLATDSWIVQVTIPASKLFYYSIDDVIQKIAKLSSELILDAKTSASLDETTEKVHE